MICRSLLKGKQNLHLVVNSTNQHHNQGNQSQRKRLFWSKASHLQFITFLTIINPFHTEILATN